MRTRIAAFAQHFGLKHIERLGLIYVRMLSFLCREIFPSQDFYVKSQINNVSISNILNKWNIKRIAVQLMVTTNTIIIEDGLNRPQKFMHLQFLSS